MAFNFRIIIMLYLAALRKNGGIDPEAQEDIIQDATSSFQHGFPRGNYGGLVATDDIDKDRVIVSEPRLFALPRLTRGAAAEDWDKWYQTLVYEFCRMSRENRLRYLSLRGYADPARQQWLRQRLEYNVGVFGELISSTILSAAEINFVLKIEAIFNYNSFAFDDQLAIFPVRSTMRHSCAPNVGIQNVGKDLVLFSHTKIAKGTELTVSYGHVNFPRDERRQVLQQCWAVDCLCPVCDLTNQAIDSQKHEVLVKRYHELIKELPALVEPQTGRLWTSFASKINNQEIFAAIDRLWLIRDILEHIPNVHSEYLAACLHYVDLIRERSARGIASPNMGPIEIDQLRSALKLAASRLKMFDDPEEKERMTIQLSPLENREEELHSNEIAEEFGLSREEQLHSNRVAERLGLNPDIYWISLDPRDG